MANFDWLKSVGATNEAVAVLNDQPNLFVNLVVVLIGLTLQCLFLWFIHFATLKPEQKRKNRKNKKPQDNARGAATAKI
ncbi:hypothetical protein HRG_002351 [Hirsutella rhossiliensis]|uniref:Uncharacterized protein n=1 Tax=Hirsutella rhossiliensis TaxID=111463 RepID=A0A9P8N978_9HYPO|nr:uncharacterized protein HRG_02351 [Hirsutella rhossiliensis]KAH0966942.1 hypothetical protein HRG_02351 [Hirsutella rhossiliensis]